MKIVIHLPRQSEAETEPNLKTDVTIRPKFYKRLGLVPVFYFTTVDAKGREERHVLLISASNKQMKVEKLVEVIPDCNVEEEAKDANNGGQDADPAAED